MIEADPRARAKPGGRFLAQGTTAYCMGTPTTTGPDTSLIMNNLPAIGFTALSLLIAACNDGPVTAAPRGNVTRTLLTDAPFPFHRVARVDIYIVSVSASLSADTSAGGGAFVTLATPRRRVNLLALQNGVTDELGAVTIPAGAISAVRMVIDTDSSSMTLQNGQVLTGRSTPGIQWQSSAGRPTLNALIHEQILVPDSGAVIVIEDRKSVV